jgi:hypothetical protein
MLFNLISLKSLGRGAIALSLAFLAGCDQIGNRTCLRDTDLSATINQAIQLSSSRADKTFSLKSATNFTWDKVYVFTPYTSHEEIQKALGFQWRQVECTTISTFDSINLLVFVQGKQVVKFAELSRGIVVNFVPKTQQGLSVQNAVFVIQREPSSPQVTLKLK